MRKSFEDEIAPTIALWRSSRSRLIEELMRVRERYNGTWVLPANFGEDFPVPTHIADAVDGLGTRAASVDFRLFAPPLDGAKADGVRSLEYAMKRRQAASWALWKSSWGISRGRFYRHLAGYSTSAIVVVPDDTSIPGTPFPRVIVRDPLHAIPEPKAAEDLTPQQACAFIYGKSREWLVRKYPRCAEHLGRPFPGGTGLWDLVEWIDEEDVVIGILGPRDEPAVHSYGIEKVQPLELKRYPNLTGRCTAVIPEAVSMDRIAARMAKLTNHSDLLAKLLAMDVQATQDGLLPDTYIVGKDGRLPTLVTPDGKWQKGRTGNVNLLEHAETVGQLRGVPDPSNKITQDRLERLFDKNAGMAGPMGGQGNSAWRSGSTIQALMAASTDPDLAELHRIGEDRMSQVVSLCLDMLKAEWPDRKYHVFSGAPTEMGMVEFTPATHIETSEIVAAYPIPGADAQNLTVALGGLVGAEFISVDTGRTLHPWVTGDESEARKVVLEKLDRMLLESVGQKVLDPTNPATPMALGALRRAYAEGKDLPDAVDAMDEAIRLQQATLAPEPGPGQLMAPEAAPGMGDIPAGGAGQPEIPPAIPEESLSGVETVRRMAFALQGASGAPQQ